MKYIKQIDNPIYRPYLAMSTLKFRKDFLVRRICSGLIVYIYIPTHVTRLATRLSNVYEHVYSGWRDPTEAEGGHPFLLRNFIFYFEVFQ